MEAQLNDDEPTTRGAQSNVLRGDILRTIVETYLTCDDWQTSVLPVNRSWASTAMPLLLDEQRCIRIRFLDLENVWYDVFQSATDVYNYRKDKEFQSQTEYAAFMMAGAHLFELSIRHGNASTLCNIFVERSVADSLNLLRHLFLPRNLVSSTRAPLGGASKEGLRFLQAACVQLSRLNATEAKQGSNNTEAITSTNDHVHIQRIGEALHNSPQHFPSKQALSRWVSPLVKENKLCDEFHKAGNQYYGINWTDSKFTSKRHNGYL